LRKEPFALKTGGRRRGKLYVHEKRGVGKLYFSVDKARDIS